VAAPVRWRLAVLGGALGKAAEMVTLLALATVVPRALGPDDYGRFAVPLTVVTIVSLALTLGGPTTMARFVPVAPPADRPALARRLGRRLALGRAVQLAVLAVAAAVAVAVAPDRFPPAVTALVVAAIALNVVGTLGTQVALGLGRTGAWSARYPVQNAVLVVAVVALDRVAGRTGAVVAIVVAGAVGAALGVAVARPVARLPAEDVPVPPGALRFGVLHAAGAALTQFAHRGGVLAVALLGAAGSADLGSEDAGFTALALGIALGVTYAVLQMFTVALPHLVGAPGDGPDGASPPVGDVPGAEATLRRLALTLVAVLVPATAVAALGLHHAVPAVFGSWYGDAASTFGPALGVVVLAPVNAVAVQVAALRLRPGAALAAGAAAAGAFVVVALVAVPAWGAPGGTAAALGGVAASAVASLVALPGAIGARLATGSLAGAAAVVALAVVA
jgi:O-antigen/teichoic acid export membrane protein